MEEEFISLRDAEKIYTIDQNYLRVLIHKKILRGEKVGRAWVTKKEWMGDYIQNRARKNGNGNHKINSFTYTISGLIKYTLVGGVAVVLLFGTLALGFHFPQIKKGVGDMARRVAELRQKEISKSSKRDNLNPRPLIQHSF